MFHLWNLDINDESITVRRLWSFYNRLPYTSETMGEMAGLTREEKVWSPDMYLLANMIDCIQALDWHFIAANSKSKPRPPKPYPRPQGKRTTTKKLWPGKTIVDKGVKTDG